MNWFKFEHATLRKPEVYRLVERLHVHRHHVVGLLCEWFEWVDQHAIDGHSPYVTETSIDDIVGHSGFAAALLEVGWLQVRSGSLVIPRFDRHLSQGSKTRAVSGERQRKHRANGVTQPSRSTRDKPVTREKKRREDYKEESTTAPPPVLVVAATTEDTSWADLDHDADWVSRKADFVAIWNDSQNTVHLPTADLPHVFEGRFRECWRDPDWGKKAATALGRLARVPLWHGRKLRLDQFLTPTYVSEILEGAHDATSVTPRRTRSTTRPTGHLTAGAHDDSPDPRLG